ncbi:hypothetical protein NEOKW01_0272 [Nematocida sp. AWRm80]|nr:hypothetical protein NEOKW01_0272 [Nematocida sp. AWRm80]
MLNISEKELVLFRLPEGLKEEEDISVEITEYKYNKITGTAIILNNNTYRLICRESSNTILIKPDTPNTTISSTLPVDRVKIQLECTTLPYDKTNILEIIPMVTLPNITDYNHYLPMHRLFNKYPLSRTEYKDIFIQYNCIIVSDKENEYIGRIEQPLVLEVFLLIRSILVSKTDLTTVKEEFISIFPIELYSLTEYLIEDTKYNTDLLLNKILSTMKEVCTTETEYNRIAKLNGIYPIPSYK